MTTNDNGKLQADRWDGIERVYTPEDVRKLRGTVEIEHTLARLGAERLWSLLRERDFLPTLGAVTGNQAVQMVKAGLEGIYVSGWQVAADANLAGATYPDQSLYPANSVPAHVRRINNALLRADQITAAEGDTSVHWMAPIVADAEAGFGGALNAFELMKAMIEAGAAGVHFEDQLASEKKCGHLGGKVLVPTNQFVRTLNAARLAADVCGVPTVLIARTDALSAKLVTSDADPADAEFLTGERTPEGFFCVRDGIEAAIARSLAYAPYADIVWFETSTRTSERRASSRRRSTSVSRASSSRTTARPRSTGARTSTTVRSRLPGGAGGARLPLPVRHAGRLPLAQLGDVRVGGRVREGGDGGVRPRPGARVRAGGVGVHGGAPPARGRRGLLRPRRLGRQPGHLLHARPRRLDGVGTISPLTDGEHGTKADEIALALEDAIVSGEVPPGTVLRQEQLSEQFEVSRTPVREALRRLAATGLVSFVPNRGVRVREISRDELREAFLIRAELEALATELATPLIDDEGLAALEDAEARFADVTTALLDRSRPESERLRLTGEWMRANYGFHDVIYEASRAPQVARAAKSARRTFLSQWRPGGPEIDELYQQNVRQHRAIKDAIVARSAAGARAVAREHVLHSCRMLELILDHVTPL